MKFIEEYLGRSVSKKHILLVSKFSSDPKVYTYASSFILALKNLGFQVSTFNCKKNYLPWAAINHDYLPGVLKVLNNKIINWRLKSAVKRLKPDIVFFVKAENVKKNTMCWILKQVQDDDQRLINFYTDNPFSFWNGNSNSNVLLSLPYYDLFLIWSKELIPILHAAGAKRVAYFPFAYDETIFKPPATISCEEQKNYQSDICFVGTWDAEREAWLTAIKASLPDVKLAIWGNGWEKVAQHSVLLRDSIRGIAIYGVEMVKVFYCSSLVLNFIRKQNLGGHNMRTFEVLASGAFMLTQRTKDQTESPFHEDVNIVCFSTTEELIQKIRYYLDHPDQRSMIIQQGMMLVQGYTLTEQLKKIFDNRLEVL